MYDYNNKPELNITPLVDVMLVLLAILMITAPVIEFEEQINLPRGSKSKQIKINNKIDIFIKKDRTVVIDKTIYNLQQGDMVIHSEQHKHFVNISHGIRYVMVFFCDIYDKTFN